VDDLTGPLRGPATWLKQPKKKGPCGPSFGWWTTSLELILVVLLLVLPIRQVQQEVDHSVLRGVEIVLPAPLSLLLLELVDIFLEVPKELFPDLGLVHTALDDVHVYSPNSSKWMTFVAQPL
jgi:hypothetical protein